MRLEEFRKLFDIPTFHLTSALFDSNNSPLPTKFDRLCETTLHFFSKKWHPHSSRQEYINNFSITKWNELSTTAKESHKLSNCDGCYNLYSSLQHAYPGKPFYESQVVVSLPPIIKENDLTRTVLSEINPKWENRFSHTFTESITNIPELNLAHKKTKNEQKKRGKGTKAKNHCLY